MEKTYLQEVGERLQKCRNRKFLSRMELSKRAGVSVKSIAKIEKGKEAIGIEDAVKICRGLGYSVEYILTGNCGISEMVRMNLKILNMPDLYSEIFKRWQQLFGLIVRDIISKEKRSNCQTVTPLNLVLIT